MDEELQLELDNLIELTTGFKKLEPEEVFENAIFNYEGINYLVEVLSHSKTAPGECEVVNCGFFKNPEAVVLSDKKLNLLPVGVEMTVSYKKLIPVEKPFMVLGLPQYAGDNVMKFLKQEPPNLAQADRWKPFLAAEMPKVFSDKNSPGPRTA